MIFLLLDALQDFVNVMGGILQFFYPILSPIGIFMVIWVNAVLSIFPQIHIAFYIVLCIILIIIGIVVNSRWPGDKPVEGTSGLDENLLEEESSESEDNETYKY
jgi:hypothetical protein